MAKKGGAKVEIEEPDSPVVARWRSVMRGFLFGGPLDEATRSRLRELFGVVLLFGTLFFTLGLVSYRTPFEDPASAGFNWGGQVGFYLANAAKLSLGNAAFFLPLLGVAWGCVLVAGRRASLVSLRVVGALCFVISTAYLLQHLAGPTEEEIASNSYSSSFTPYGPGGWLALQTSPALIEKFGNGGWFIVLLALSVVSFFLATEMGFYDSLRAFGAWLEERRAKRGESFLAAVGGYLRTLGFGLWNFVRGADLREGLDGAPALATAAVAEMPSATSPETKRRSRKPAEAEEELPAELRGLKKADEDELEEEFEDELDEDEEFGEDLTPEELAELEAQDAPDDEDDLDADEDDEGAVAPKAAKSIDGDDDDEEPVQATPAAAPKLQPVKAKIVESRYEPPTPPLGPWVFPPIELLQAPEKAANVDDGFLVASADKLQNALKSFRVEAQVVSAQVGPAVTLFELTVAQGTRMNKVTQLSQEIAAALRAQSVRVIAPIPGRETIGIEVPNQKRRIVRISELVTQRAYDPKIMALPLFLGMDAEGGPIVEDMARMPHVLIAGTTGSGKSVCINTILASLLLTRSPHDVKLILIDPKMVELQAFSSVPHLMCPVVTDARQATGVLLWAVEKMEGRYELFKTAGVKNVKGYNALSEDELKTRMGEEWNDERTPRHLPYIVVVIDEFADLMAVSKKEAELAITRLAQKSRAAGIHVVVATQRPSTDVITGVIKGNLPTRIAFQVASKVDSRVILDEMGADKLLGHGDMLFMPPGGAKLKRVQGALVEDAEVQRLVDFVSRTSGPSFSQELIQVASGERPAGGGLVDAEADEDPMFDEAVRVVLKSKRGSASLLQRALGVGYTRASRLIDLMSERNILGPHKGSKVRDILVTLEQWEELHGPSTGGASDRLTPQDHVDE